MFYAPPVGGSIPAGNPTLQTCRISGFNRGGIRTRNAEDMSLVSCQLLTPCYIDRVQNVPIYQGVFCIFLEFFALPVRAFFPAAVVLVVLPAVLGTDIRRIFLLRLFDIRISGSTCPPAVVSFFQDHEMATRRRNVLQVRPSVNRRALQFYPGGWLPLREKNLVYRRYYADVAPLKP
jgi:hypothetical protein